MCLFHFTLLSFFLPKHIDSCVCSCGFSEQLCASELHGRRTSISSGEKIVCDLQAHQTAYSQDQDRAESELDPDRDIQLELCALDLEDSDHQEIKSQVGIIM